MCPSSSLSPGYSRSNDRIDKKYQLLTTLLGQNLCGLDTAVKVAASIGMFISIDFQRNVCYEQKTRNHEIILD